MKQKKSELDSLRIAIDAMGGDFAPVNEVNGAIQVFETHPNAEKLEIVLVGDETKIKEQLAKVDHSKLKFSIVHAEEVVSMDDEPTIAVKKKKNSSLYKGMELLQQGKVDAFVSAGNTGAVLATATVLLGRIKGVSRPTIGTFFPSQTDIPTFVMDVGANIDSKPRFLYEFAVMGNIHVKNLMGVENPKIGLLNIGEETSKGTEVVQETYKLLSQSNLNFIGNVEGRDVLKGTAHVIVCDGFTGNIILKFAESFVGFLKSNVMEYGKKGIINLMLLGIVKPVLKKILMQFDYQEYGGVPLLGVDGVVIIGHGKSTPKAIKHMLFRAMEMVTKDINGKIEEALRDDIEKEIKT
jgi:glycerol-3-phosphate acyltransferase PlsX